MPVRARIVERLVQDVAGPQWFNNLNGFNSMPTAEYHKVSEAADVLFERIVDRIDWPRILIEACSRHYDLVRSGTHSSIKNDIVLDVCGNCLQETLLTDDHSPRHSPEPQPRLDRGQDWLGEMVRIRIEYGTEK